MKDTLNIFDVSSMLYAGQCAKAYSTKNDTLSENRTVEGIPIGGVRYSLRVAIQKLKDKEDILLVFDSKTDKQREFQDYKGNRTFNPAVMVQQLMLRDAATRMKLPMLQVDNYEADDLIAAVVSQYFYKYSNIHIYTGDTDLAANIYSDRVDIHGVASIYPSIDSSNYEFTVKHGLRIQYNTILPYYAIYGKQSNNVPAIGDKALCDSCYLAFLEYSTSVKANPAQLSTIPHFANWLLFELNKKERSIEEKVIEQLYDRISYVFPKPYSEELKIQFLSADELPINEVSFFLKTFNMTNELLWFDDVETMSSPKTPQMLEYIRSYKNTYFTGTMAADNDLSADNSFFTGAPSEFFMDEGDF